MRAALNIVLDPRQRALAGARFRAWWEGEAFDESLALAALEGVKAEAANPAEAGDLDRRLFGPAADPRLEALQLLWGEGRLAPDADAALAALLALAPEEKIALLGAGLYASAAAFANDTEGRLTIYEWRAETRAALEHGLSEHGLAAKVELLDLDVTTLPGEAFDALASFDEFTYAANPKRLALQIVRALKPGGRAAIEAYCGAAGEDYGAAFASAFAEPQIHSEAVLAQALSEAGLEVVQDEDVSLAHIMAARDAFQRFASAAGEGAGGEGARMRELDWETRTWRARLRMLASARLQRRRILAKRPA
ncbi:MAG: methyltransferase domain-containing protein [Hyphomonadaceae bacterium]